MLFVKSNNFWDNIKYTKQADYIFSIILFVT
jgi:hypothetical protein